MLFAWLDEIQRAAGIEGDIFEIGVHHGKSAVLMGSLLRPSESLGVCDVFAKNISGSGHGNREIFEANMSRYQISPIRILEGLSEDLSPMSVGENYRLFHIDGGHTVHEALGDLHLASACLSRAGVIAIDDPFRAEWPGVIEAIIAFLQNTDYVSILVGFNKMLIVDPRYAGIYLSEFDDPEVRNRWFCDPWQLKQMAFVGQMMRVIYAPTGGGASQS